MRRMNICLVCGLLWCGSGLVYAQKFKTYNDQGAKMEFKVTSREQKTVMLTDGERVDELIIPATVEYKGETYRVTSIKKRAYMPSSKMSHRVRKLVLPEGLEEIGDWAFYLAFLSNGQESIYIPSTVKAIGKHAFARHGFGVPMVRDCVLENLPSWVTEENCKALGLDKNAVARYKAQGNTGSGAGAAADANAKKSLYSYLQEGVNNRINTWMKRLPGESNTDYLARTSEESIKTQRLQFEKELTAEMAGDRANSHVSNLQYNTDEGLLGVSFTDMPSITLAVPSSDVMDINSQKGLQFTNTVYQLSSNDEFEILYTEAINPETGKKYTYTKSTSTQMVDNNAYIRLTTVQQDMVNNQRLQMVAAQTVQEAKERNILSDNTHITVATKLIPSAEGKTDYRISYNYTVNEGYSATEDFAPGKYDADKSAASTAMMRIIRESMSGDFAQYLQSGKALDISYHGSADAKPIKGKIAYNGNYGSIEQQAVTINGQAESLTITKSTGITSNEQLSLVRAISVRAFIRKNIPALKDMVVTDTFHVEVSSDEGSQFRRVAVDFTFRDVSF